MIITPYIITNSSYAYTNTTTAKQQHSYPPLKGSPKLQLKEMDVKFVINSQNKMTIAIGFKKTHGFMGSGIAETNPCL